MNLGLYRGEKGYLQMLNDIMDHGKDRGDRTGTGTRSVFSSQIEFDLQQGFPALTTKKLAFKTMVGELLWFLNGNTDLKSLREFTHGQDNNQHTIWTDDITKFNCRSEYSIVNDGGNLYGKQWRNFEGCGMHSGTFLECDQIREVLEIAKKDPTSRRMVINAWNAAEIKWDQTALPPCHFAVQFYIEDSELNCKWSQRSCDSTLGIPFNIASYALLTHLFAKWLGLEVGSLIGDLTNVHIYKDHFDGVSEQLTRTPYKLPTISIPDTITLDNIHEFTAGNFELVNYQHHPAIKFQQSS